MRRRETPDAVVYSSAIGSAGTASEAASSESGATQCAKHGRRPRRRGGRKWRGAGERSQLTFYVANVTSLSVKAMQHIASVRARAHVIGLAETHVTKAAHRGKFGHELMVGHRWAVANAIPSGSGGTIGGCAVGVKKGSPAARSGATWPVG